MENTAERGMRCHERGSGEHPAIARRVSFRVVCLCTLLLWLVGCATTKPNTTSIVLRENADARLATRVWNGLFLTQALIGDREVGPFLLDTGATFLTLDAGLAKDLKLDLSGASEIHYPAGKQKATWGTLPAITIGPLAFRNLDVAITDLSSASAPDGEKLAGLLGRPFFLKAVVEVDYRTGIVRCLDPKTYRLPRGEWVPLTYKDGVPVIPARLEGGPGHRRL